MGKRHIFSALALAILATRMALGDGVSATQAGGVLDSKRRALALEYVRRAEEAIAKAEAGSEEGMARGNLILAKARLGDIVGAKKMAEGMEAESRAHHLEDIAVAQANSGDTAGARETFEAARGLIKTDRYSDLSDLGKSQVAAGDLEGARSTANWLPLDSWRAEVVIAIAELKLKTGDEKGARGDLAAAHMMLHREPELVSEMALAFYKAGDVAGAKSFIGEMNGAIEKADAWQQLGQLQLASGDKVGALSSAGEAKQFLKEDRKGPIFFRMRISGSIGVILAKCGDAAGLQEIWLQAKADAESKLAGKPDAYTRIVCGIVLSFFQWKAGDEKGSNETLSNVLALIASEPTQELRERVYWRAAESRARLGDLDSATAIIQLLLKEPAGENRNRSDDFGIAYGIQGVAKACGEADHADLGWIEKLHSSGERANALAGAAVGFATTPKK